MTAHTRYTLIYQERATMDQAGEVGPTTTEKKMYERLDPIIEQYQEGLISPVELYEKMKWEFHII